MAFDRDLRRRGAAERTRAAYGFDVEDLYDRVQVGDPVYVI